MGQLIYSLAELVELFPDPAGILMALQNIFTYKVDRIVKIDLGDSLHVINQAQLVKTQTQEVHIL
jgi:hypothetical protein